MASYALVGARVLGADGRLSEATITVSDGVIAHVRPAGEEVDAGIATVDAAGCTIIPGLIDLHTHLGNPAAPFMTGAIDAGVYAPHNAIRALRSGVTTARDLGGIAGADLRLRAAIEAGIYPGPDMYCSGAHLRTTGGHTTWPDGTGGVRADGQDEVRRATREQLAAGADWIKVFTNGGVGEPSADRDSQQYTEAELRVIVEEAAMLGARVTVHAYSSKAMATAVRAGVASIEHGNYADEALLALMAEHGTFMVPTYSAYQMLAESGRAAADRAELSARILAEKAAQLEAMDRLGVAWGIGSDGGGNMPAELILDELRFVAKRLGLGAAEAIRRATSVNAELLGLTDRGRIEAGLRADLLVVEGDPLQSIDDLALVRATVVGGRMLDWRDLAAEHGVWPVDPSLRSTPGWDWQAHRNAPVAPAGDRTCDCKGAVSHSE